jgi:hypothetical protein
MMFGLDGLKLLPHNRFRALGNVGAYPLSMTRAATSSTHREEH